MRVSEWRADKSTLRRSTTLRTAHVFCFGGKRGDLGQACHRDLPKPRVEEIEPAPDADGRDRKIADRGVVNTFDAGVPRGDARRCERSFAPQTPGDERRQVKTDRLV